jgi:hypothetical protein
MDDSKFVKEWEQTRQRGFWRFVLGRAVYWVIFFAVFMLLGVWLDDDPFEPVRFLLMLVGYFGVGCLFSPLGWYTREVHYRDILERSSQARE